MRTVAIVALLLVLAATPAQALTLEQAHEMVLPQAQLSEFRFAHDSWALTDDKAAHFGMGFTLSIVTAWLFNVHSESGQWKNLIWNTLFWTAWEVKDGHMPYEKYGKIGGDGWSTPDWGYSNAGNAGAMIIW